MDMQNARTAQRLNNNPRERVINDEESDENNAGEYGFKGRMFPLLGFIIGIVAVFGSYYVARHKSPPDVHPFPQTDITHSGIKFPEYTIMRIGLMVAAPIFAISFQLLKYRPMRSI